jgi:hypothetical protein
MLHEMYPWITESRKVNVMLHQIYRLTDMVKYRKHEFSFGW